MEADVAAEVFNEPDLSDTLTDSVTEGLVGISVDQNDLDLTTVTRVDKTGRVEYGHTMLGGEAATRVDQRSHRRRQLKLDARGHDGTTARLDEASLDGRDIKRCVVLGSPNQSGFLVRLLYNDVVVQAGSSPSCVAAQTSL